MAADSGRERDDNKHKPVQRFEQQSAQLNSVEGPAAPGGLGTIAGTLLGDSRLNGRGNQPVKVAVMRQAQRTYGNRAVQRFLHSASRAGANIATEAGSSASVAVQRHPEGVALLEGKEQAVAEATEAPFAEGLFARLRRYLGGGGSQNQSQQNTGSTTANSPTGANGTSTTGMIGTAGTTSATGTATPTTTGPTTQSTDTSATGTTGTTTNTTPAPPPSSPYFMELSRGQEVLQAAFGTVHTIVPGNIVVLDNNEAIWERYDQVSRGRNNIYVTPNRTWQDGDARAAFPLGLNGFADAGTVYINRMTTSPTTTVHEMLHLNTAAGYRRAVGETVNEGTTQYLAIKALRQANVALPASLPYAQETELAGHLARLVGEDIVIQAYFGGANTLIDAVDRALGAGSWTRFKALADARDFTGAAAALRRPLGDFPMPTGDTRLA